MAQLRQSYGDPTAGGRPMARSISDVLHSSWGTLCSNIRDTDSDVIAQLVPGFIIAHCIMQRKIPYSG